MASKLSLVVVFVCLLQVCLSAQIPSEAAATTKKDVSSEELTMEEVTKIQQELAKVMPAPNAERFGNVMRKLTKGATSAENAEGAMQLLAMALAGATEKTEEEWKKMFEDSSEEKITKTKE